MERTLALICGAGPLPARMASQARGEGWRVVAFTFAAEEGLDEWVARVVPSRITELGPVLAAFHEEKVGGALFSGKFWMQELLSADRGQADTLAASFEERAQSRSGSHLSRVIVATLAGLGIEILDQRDFMGDWLAEPGCLTPRVPTEEELRDVHTGLGVARAVAEEGVGQTVVLRHGIVTAVEAVEGTTVAIERGMALAGPGAVIVKAVARDHDYRFDLPAIGPDTIEAAAGGRASVLAIQAGQVVLLERQQALARAAALGLAVVAVVDDAAR